MGVHIGFEDIQTEQDYPDSEWDSVRYAVDNIFVQKMHLMDWLSIGDGIYTPEYLRPKDLSQFESFITENFDKKDHWRLNDMLKIFKSNPMAFLYVSW